MNAEKTKIFVRQLDTNFECFEKTFRQKQIDWNTEKNQSRLFKRIKIRSSKTNFAELLYILNTFGTENSKSMKKFIYNFKKKFEANI